MSIEYCINCKYGIDGNGVLPVCRRDVRTEIHEWSKACTYFIKSIILPRSDHELIESMGKWRDNYEFAEELQKISPIYFDESKNLWLWKTNEKYWKKIDETDVLNCARKPTGEYVINSTMRQELLTAVLMTGRNREVKPIKKSWVHYIDGVVDITTKKNIIATKEYFFTSPVPHKMGLDENTPTIDKLFKDWLGENAPILYEICAYCLIDSYPIHRMFLLFGRGRNGKSQFLKLLSNFIGINNTTSTDLEKVIESKFEAAKLYRKKIALIGETDFAAIKSTDRLKRLTGDDLITGEYKHKDPFDFNNTAKILIATNSLPESLDKTDGFYSRCIILEFKNQFDEGKSIVESIPEIEYENLLLKCIKLLPELLEKGKFFNEGTIEEKGKKYESLSNPFLTFKNQSLSEEVEHVTPIWKIYDLYEIFCKKNGFRIVSKKELTQILQKDGYEVKKHRFGEKSWSAVFGLDTKEPFILYEDVPDVPDVPGVSISSLYGEEIGTRGTCGTCGTQKETVLEKSLKVLKERYDNFGCPSPEDFDRLTKNMCMALTTEIEELDEINTLKIVQDYQTSRRWR